MDYKEQVLVPRIDNLLDRLKGVKLFYQLDLKIGYHQMRVEDSSVPMIAFKTRYGLYKFRVMPFGLINAPAFFMNLINTLFQPFLDRFVIIFIDDSFEEHKHHLKHVLDVLRDQKLHAKFSKCHFWPKKVYFLGLVVLVERISVNPDKVVAIREWK